MKNIPLLPWVLFGEWNESLWLAVDINCVAVDNVEGGWIVGATNIM